MELKQSERANKYVTVDNLNVLVKKIHEKNTYVTECLQKQAEVNKALDSNVDKLLKNQEDLYEIILDLNENDCDLENQVKHNTIRTEIGAIIDTIVIAGMAVLLMISSFRISNLEEKLKQYEQNQSIVLEDNSTELVDDKV